MSELENLHHELRRVAIEPCWDESQTGIVMVCASCGGTWKPKKPELHAAECAATPDRLTKAKVLSHKTNLVASNPSCLNGMPRVAGTRIPTETLWGYLIEDGRSLEEVLEMMPFLTKEEVVAALTYEVVQLGKGRE